MGIVFGPGLGSRDVPFVSHIDACIRKGTDNKHLFQVWGWRILFTTCKCAVLPTLMDQGGRTYGQRGLGAWSCGCVACGALIAHASSLMEMPVGLV